MEHLSRCWEQAHATGQFLSVKDHDTFAAVQRLQNELQNTKARAAALEEESFRRTAQEYAGRGDCVLVVPPLQGDGVRRLCDAVSHTCGGRCAVFAGENGRYQYAVIHAGQDIRSLVKDMNTALNGRGGGRDGFAQGSVQADETQIHTFFENL
jgi:alanyl-tRNA synthetase